jgi:hypothetical protein
MSGINKHKALDIGVAQTDITPDWPIRLAGFAARIKSETEEVLQPLTAKALAFGSNDQSPCVLIVVEIIGIQRRITNSVAKALYKAGISPDNLTILVTHTHGSPEVGNLINILQCRGDYPSDHYFNDALLTAEELTHIARFNEFLIQKLIDVALAALDDKKPAFLAWGQGEASFAVNRRTKDGPVDHALSVLRVTDLDGNLRAVFMSYACHGISLGADENRIHGDWMGEAQRLIEDKNPGCIAMMAIGCAGDSHPVRRDKLEYMSAYGAEIADKTEALLSSELAPLTTPPVVKTKWIKLPFAQTPAIAELMTDMTNNDIKGYYSRLALEQILRGNKIPAALDYPIQVWDFGNKMTMINMGGEVVVDYAFLLKQKYGNRGIWINSYANEVSCYIPSKRILTEGGYEGDTSMYWYNQPSPFLWIIEDKILNTVEELMPINNNNKARENY